MTTDRSAGPGFADLLQRDAVLARATSAMEDPPPAAWLCTLARLVLADQQRATDRPRLTVEAIVAELDRTVSEQLNGILHAHEFQALESTWRGLWMLVRAADTDTGVKVRVLDIGKRELARTLRKFRGNAWDHSPIFHRIYEEEFGQLGGEPYGLLVGDYAFDHRPDDVALLGDVAKIAAAAHAPFLAAAAPSLFQMESWAEVANPRDLTRIVRTPEYTPWQRLREEEDTRYIGLCMPRFLARLPYGSATNPLDAFTFEEDTEGTDVNRLLWGNAAFAFGANVVRAFATYGWCVRIRGVDRGGVVEGLPVLHHPTADGDVDRRTVTEICLSEGRDAELASCGLIPLMHRKNSNVAAFISAQSLQRPQIYDDDDATANATLSARLPYLFACCRFAHYLKCMVRDKVGSTMSRTQIANWLSGWLISHVDGSPATSTEEFKAAHPLSDARVVVTDRDDMPGTYEAKFFLQPHYQLEGLSVTLRLASRLSAHSEAAGTHT
jgi:type VI secretion system protein ImpC